MTTYITGGVSQNRNGAWKVRHSTLSVEDSVVRQVKSGDENIFYVELPKAMTRDELPGYLLTLKEFSSVPEYRQVLELTVAKRQPKPVKAKPVAVVKTAIKMKMPSKPVVEQIDAHLAAMAV